MEKTITQAFKDALANKQPANGGNNCASCRHMEPAPQDNPNATCHRFPPQILGTMIVNPQTGQVACPHTFFFPEIGDPSAQWCGEFSAKLSS
jgi:hypothetical protein